MPVRSHRSRPVDPLDGFERPIVGHDGGTHATVWATADSGRSDHDRPEHVTESTTAAASASVAPPAVDDLVPLTPLQLEQLTRTLINPTDLTLHRLCTWVVEGRPDRAALAAAIAAVHWRHEPLRAAYRSEPSPVAHVLATEPPPLEELPDQPALEPAIAAVREVFAGELLVQEGDVWRTAVVSAGPSTVFGCVVHHIAFDSRSESVLARDLATAYHAAVRGEDPAAALGAPRRLVKAHRLHGRSTARALEDRHRERLRAELAGVPALRCPGEPTPSGADGPATIEVRLPDQVVTATQRRAAEAGVSRFAVLLAEYAAAVAEVTGQRDFAIGVPVAQRDDPYLQDAVGCHTAMTCIRLRGAALDGGTAALQEVGRLFDAARDVPLHGLANPAALPGRPLSTLFQALFAVHDDAPVQLTLDGMRTSFVRRPYLALPLDLHAELWPDDGGGLLLTVYFHPDTVPGSCAAAIAKRYEHRLSATLQGGRS